MPSNNKQLTKNYKAYLQLRDSLSNLQEELNLSDAVVNKLKETVIKTVKKETGYDISEMA